MEPANGSKMPRKTGLQRAIDTLGGSQNAFAKALGVHRQSVAYWLKHRVPADRVIAIEKLTGVPRHELAPELFADYKRDSGR